MLTIFLDCVYVLFVAWITEKLKEVIEEYILHGTIEATTNHELLLVFKFSQVVVISISIIYMIMDIIRHILKAIREFKK